MNDATRLMLAFTLISVPTIQYGGYFLLTVLRYGSMGGFTPSPLQKSFFRAGHAHAGVLVILGLICQLLIPETRLPDAAQWALRVGMVAAPILVSAGFFAAVPSPEMKAPGQGIRLLYVGAIILALSVVGLGIGLLLPA